MQQTVVRIKSFVSTKSVG